MKTYLQAAGASLALAMAIGTGCTLHDHDNQHAADKAAQKVADAEQKSDDKVAASSRELDRAARSFREHKELRVMGLETERAMIAPQGEIIRSLADQLPLTGQARKDVDTKADAFDQKLADVDAKLSKLAAATADQWSNADDEMADAMKQLEQSRDDAWKTFRHAKRTDRSS